MITRVFAEPAYRCIRLMDITNCIPLALDLKTGKFHRKQPISAIIHWIVYLTSVLKVLHFVYAVIKMIVNFKHESFPQLILTVVLLSLSAYPTYWGWELFHKGTVETVILFNSLEYAHSSPRYCLLGYKGVQKRTKRPKFWAKLAVPRLSPRCIISTLMSLSLQELLIVLAPFAVKLFVPLYLLMIVIFPDWDIFTTSLMYSQDGWNWGMIFCVGFEAVSAFCFESNILFFFIFSLALQVTHLARIKMDIAHMR